MIKSHILAQGGQQVSKGKIILATVQGDIHDIGKNIVKVILENYGYQVIDLGRDVPPEKVVVVYNAVARHEVERRYEIPPRIRHEKRVLFLGRVTFQKGPEYFMEAARLVLQKIPNARFFMAGSGDMLPQLIRRAGQLRIGHRFHFAGFCAANKWTACSP